MKRAIVLVGMLAVVMAGGFAAQDAPPRAPQAAEGVTPDLDVPTRVGRLETRTVRLEERTIRLESALRRSEETIATLTKQVKTLTEAQERFARAIAVDSGGVRISGNLRLDGNMLEDTTTVDCDNASTSGPQRRCTCPDGRVAIGIELRPIAVSAVPGPSTYNTALVCSRM